MVKHQNLSMVSRLFFLLVFMMLYTVSSIALADSKENHPLKLAFIYENPVDAGGWSQAHEQARLAIEKLFGDKIVTQSVEGVKPGADISRVMTKYARENYDAIFATSFGYMRTVMKLAPQFPKTHFFHCVGLDTAENIGTYLTRAYQGSYMAGVLAAYTTKTNVLGFVASFPVPEVIAGVNAFTLGARSVKPDIVVKMLWVNSWSDPTKERAAADVLMDESVDVITHHTETSSILVAAEQRGIYAIGYQSNRSAAAPTHHLASIVHNWTPLYRDIIQSLLDNSWKPGNLWYGVKQGAVSLEGVSDQISPAAKKRLQAIEAEFKADQLKIFQGPLRNNKRQLIIPENQAASDREIMSMNWLVEGVAGSIEQ